MIGKLVAGLIGARIGGKKHETGGALAGVAVEVVAKRVIPLLAAAGLAAYAYKKVKSRFESEDEPR